MAMRIPAVSVGVLALVLNACAASSAPSSPDATTKPDTARVPLTDLATGTYRGFQGGLYPGGSNTMPAAHAALGTTFARSIRPLNAAGQPDANGKIVLLSVGMSNVTQEFCGGGPAACQSFSFVGQALADPSVDRTHLVIVDGAQGGKVIPDWDQVTDATYTTVRDTRLAALGVTEAQVQVVWLKQATPGPTAALPAANADAYTIAAGLGTLVRTLSVRYPNLQIVFLSSRIYAGYAQSGTLNPEPFAYETGFAVKWLIEAQIRQGASGAPDALAGDLRPGVAAPWLSWGPYLWANGTAPRADGLTWVQADFAADNTHPNTGARQKVGAMLLSFMRSSPHASCWFLSGRTC
ncbi:MAG: hypothetical protein Q8K55_11225 [Gemmatimonadaceae bacterium]|nr:hypothetical protein [Gemmatimonadaceae bacterium]